VRTRVGYSGGKQPKADYHDLKDHTETLQIQFDPTVVTYRQLLEIFWSSHDYVTPIKKQYKSVIFYLDDEQKAEAEATFKLVEEGKLGNPEHKGKPVLTVIEPATQFHVAEVYHQKYQLQCNHEVIKHLRYTSVHDITEDPVAARLNGYLAGYGEQETLLSEIEAWPLPFLVKFHLLRGVVGRGIVKFKPIDESEANNPLPIDFLSVQQQLAAVEGKARAPAADKQQHKRKESAAPTRSSKRSRAAA